MVKFADYVHEFRDSLGFPRLSEEGVQRLEELVNACLPEMPPPVVYNRRCPWGCGFFFGVVDFRIETYPISMDKKRLLFFAYYEVEGFGGSCPGCGKPLWFSRRRIARAARGREPRLPDDWHKYAEIVGESK